MLQTTACPDAPALRRFVLGLTSGEEGEVMAAHLEGCDQCLETLQGLQPADELLQALQKAPATGNDLPVEVEERMVQRLAALGYGLASSGAGTRPPTVTPSEANGPLLDPLRGELTDEVYTFLAPAQGPGELGRLGAFRVLKVLGTGGMGVVFLALDSKLKRPVAIKALRPALAVSASARQRFLREAQAAAALEHDNIVPIYHVGEEGGFPYLVMPFLHGETLEDHLQKSTALTPLQAAQIGRDVARGLAAAHARGLIHRDIKPGNIWLEATGKAKLLDFGLARAAGTEEQLTQSGLILGTPQYMAPEQATGGIVGPSCDLFSLGCVLYHMTVGEPPFTGPDTMSVLASLAVDTPVPPATRNPAVPAAFSDLIVRHLEKDCTRRPGSAQEIAAALERIERALAQENSPAVPEAPLPVEPQPQTAPRRAWPRRWLAAAALLAVAATACVIVTVRGKRIEVPEGSEVAIDDRGRVQITIPPEAAPPVQRVSEEPAAPAPRPRTPFDDLKADDIPAAERYDWQPPGLVAVLGEHAWRHGGPVVYTALTTDGQTVASGGSEWGGYNYHLRLWDRATGREKGAFTRPYISGFTNEFAITPDGRLAIIGDGYGATAFDAPTGKVRHRLPCSSLWQLFVSRDGKRVCLINVHDLPAIQLFDLEDGTELARLDVPKNDITRMFYCAHPDLRMFLVGQLDPMDKGPTAGGKAVLKLWDPATKQEPVLDHGGSFRWPSKISFIPDGKALASWHSTGLRYWDLETGKQVLSSPLKMPDDTFAWTLAPDGKTLADSDQKGRFRLWDIATGKAQGTFGPADGTLHHRICRLAYSADGKTLIAGDLSGTVQLWDVASGKRLNPLRGHESAVEAVAVSPDGRRIASRDAAGVVILWDVVGTKSRHRLESRTPVTAMAFPANGKDLVTGDQSGAIMVWDAATGKAAGTLQQNGPAVTAVAASADGQLLATTAASEVHVWDTTTGKGTSTWRLSQDPVQSVAFSPDGRRLAVGNVKGQVKAWDLGTKKELLFAKGPVAPVWSLAFSADGKDLAATQGRLRYVHGSDWVTGQLTVWDVSTGKQKEAHTRPEWSWGHVETSVAFAPDGQSVFTAVRDFGKCVIQRFGPSRSRQWRFPWPVNALALTPDGRHLVTANGNGTLYVLRVGTP